MLPNAPVVIPSGDAMMSVAAGERIKAVEPDTVNVEASKVPSTVNVLLLIVLLEIRLVVLVEVTSSPPPTNKLMAPVPPR